MISRRWKKRMHEKYTVSKKRAIASASLCHVCFKTGQYINKVLATSLTKLGKCKDLNKDATIT